MHRGPGKHSRALVNPIIPNSQQFASIQKPNDKSPPEGRGPLGPRSIKIDPSWPAGNQISTVGMQGTRNEIKVLSSGEQKPVSKGLTSGPLVDGAESSVPARRGAAHRVSPSSTLRIARIAALIIIAGPARLVAEDHAFTRPPPWILRILRTIRTPKKVSSILEGTPEELWKSWRKVLVFCWAYGVLRGRLRDCKRSSKRDPSRTRRSRGSSTPNFDFLSRTLEYPAVGNV
ncbi:hypothetical protein KM043_001047 [Ampulex compressa]|nr:hypothetical protein KM043_001047 [Ampulex compressa]